MKLSEKKTGEFIPHPETELPVRAVIVDVTPLKKRHTDFGVKEEFRLVFESALADEQGTRFCVWSRGYTPSLNEKATFRKDLRRLLGRDLTAQELEEYDTESLIGKGARLMIEHTRSKDGTQVYANIAMMRPDADPIEPGGKYVRVQDRDVPGGDGDGDRDSDRDSDSDEDDDLNMEDGAWEFVEVHVGKHRGRELGSLDAEAVTALIERWLPKIARQPELTREDRRLIAALERVKELLAALAEEEPF